MRCKELWIDENERIIEAYQDGEIEHDEFMSTLLSRGFDKDEIDGIESSLDIQEPGL